MKPSEKTLRLIDERCAIVKLARKEVWIIGLLIVSVLVVGIAMIFRLPTFGGKVSGERLARMQANPQYKEGAFVNVEPEAPLTLSQGWSFIAKQFFYDEVRVPPSEIPVVTVAPSSLELSATAALRAFWIGHASTYVEIDGARILIDPIFSDFASPFNYGPKRFHSPPIALTDLPGVDAVVISHDHYDHLDMPTVMQLAKEHINTLFYVPLGVGAHLQAWGIPEDRIVELDWWQEHSLGEIKIVCTPTRHYSGRGLMDRKATLWSSWTVIGPHHRFYYSGDTGYSNHFREIGERFGPFDMSFVKVGAYGPGASWLDVHMDPEHAVQAHIDVQAKRMFPVHWGTFNLAFHDWDEPIKRTLLAAKKQKIELVTPRVGEFVSADQVFRSENWWEGVK
jgi:L-ascorbate metabolism protein UlaG (beta-lactamase superfamily)